MCNKKPITVKYPNFNPNEENPYQEEMDKLLDISLTEASTTRSIKNINECLTKSLKSKYGIRDKEQLKEAVNETLKIHGMSAQNFDPLSTISKLTFGEDKNVNNYSVDDNANKTCVNMEGICGEAFLPYKKVAGYDYEYQSLKEIFGKDEAKKCCASMYDLSLALNDSTKITIPYCYCIDASKLVIQGRNFGQVHSSPAHRVNTYISILCDTIREISFNIAGACLHHSQGLIMQENGNLVYKNIKDLVNSTTLPMTYSNYQGDWEYADISSRNLKVMENGKFVKVNKLMRRKYDGNIYEVTTKSGKTVKCSKDHKFKVLFKGRDIEVKAEDLQLYDTVYNTMITTNLPVDKNSKDYKRGQFIGMLCGDGCITNQYETRLSVHKEQMYINEAYKSFVKENYNKDVSLTEDKRSPLYDSRFCSTEAHDDICKDIVGIDAKSKHINIKDKSIDYLVGFLDGLFVTDGYYNKSIGLSSISEELIKNVYDICKILNIKTSDIRFYDSNRGNRNGIYSVNLSLKIFNYLDLFQKKAKSNKRFVGKRIDEMAYFGCNAFSHSSGLSTGNKIKTYKERDVKIHAPVTDVVVDIKKMNNDDEYVYEIETESHWYSVGGLLTHNCAIGSFFLDIAHLAIYKERITLDDLRTDKKTRKYIGNCLQQFIHSVNHYSRNSVESPFTNVSCFDRDKLINLISDENYGWYFPKKAAVVEDNELENNKEVFKDFVLDYIEELQEIYIDIFDAGDPLRNGLQFPFPVTTCNLSITVDENGERRLTNPDDKLYNYIVGKDISKYNIYCSEGTKVASCCRLLSDAEMLGLGEGVNSFGGSQISLGSHRVVTTDMFRAACEATSYDDFKKILTERVEESAKILQAHRVLLHKLEKCGTQPWISNGWINMSHLFSTFGCVGYVEADKLLKYKFNHKDFDYMKDFLVYFNNECKRVAESYKMIWNIEAIPAEGMAPKLAKADKIIFGDENGCYNGTDFKMPDILANQWCSLWEDHTIYEKMKRDGQIQKLMTGGSIVHINIDSKITRSQAKRLIEDSVKFGMAHFALNACYVECQECGTVVKGYLDECPNCHSTHLNHYSRVIGYFSKVESWGKVRREKDFPNRKFLNPNDIKRELGD